MQITVEELMRYTGARLLFGDRFMRFENITTSSRNMKGRDLFIPIVGEKADGHAFIASAFAQGAVVSFTEKEEIAAQLQNFAQTKALVKVEHSVQALQKFSENFRKEHVDIPYVGITGSVGKTSTREMIAAALSSERYVYETRGNANSQVGVPITVFETDPKAQVGVVELGISEFGEMEKISHIVDAQIALITNIGISHIAQFGTQENILREKLKILSGDLKQVTLLVNGDDPLLCDLTEEKIHEMGIRADKKINILRFGFDEKNDYRAVKINSSQGPAEFEFVKRSSCDSVKVALSVYGEHMVQNAVAALAVADLMGLDLEKAAASLGRFEGFEGRGKLLVQDGVTIINDSYNASPASMKAGLRVLGHMPAQGRKIAVLADMKELGPREKIYHRQIGDLINEEMEDLDILLTYGDLAEITGDVVAKKGKTKTAHFTSFEEMKSALYELLRPGDLLFVKGSWSMGLKDLIKQ